MASAGYIGQVGEFNSEKETFTSYCERFELFAVANDLMESAVDTDEARNKNELIKVKKRAIFLTQIGAEMFSLVESVCAPEKPATKSLNDLQQLMCDHFNPKPIEIAECFHFGTRDRHENETIGEYIVALKKLSRHCNFGNFLTRALRDRFVCGLKNERIQNKLLNMSELDFNKACQTACAMEMAQRQASFLKPSTSTGDTVSATHKLVPYYKKKDASPADNKHFSGAQRNKQRCRRCNGFNHKDDDCKFKNAQCFKCKARGHISPVCKKFASSKTHELCEEEESECGEDTETVYTMFNCTGKGPAPWKVTVKIQGVPIEMEIDTGATYSVISDELVKKLTVPLEVYASPIKLKSYTGQVIRVTGEAQVTVEYGEQKHMLKLLVVPGKTSALLGRDWLSSIKLDWRMLNPACVNNVVGAEVGEIKQKFSSLFREEIGKLQGFQAHLEVDEAAKPKFCKPRPVSFYMRDKLDAEFQRLRNAGIVEDTTYSEWASPVVPVLKRDNSVRVCGDYKVTINQVIKKETYPLPTPEELFSKVEGGVRFAKMDLSHAYQQIELDEASQKLMVINTHQGLLKYKRLNYGVASAPAIFQRAMEGVLDKVPGTAVFLDDVIVTGKTVQEYERNLALVLEKLVAAGLTLKEEKCEFGVDSVTYLGYKVSRNGLETLPERLKPIMDAPPPTCVSELKSYLGMLTYYSRFLEDISTLLEPLHELLRKETKWQWTAERDKVFRLSKEKLRQAPVLTHYDPHKPMVVSCDASPYGVGGVLSLVNSDGMEEPVAFASRKLNAIERRYSQLDKEGLAVIFAIKKFHKYLEGRQFVIQTDHKPLLGLFGANKAIPVMASPRVVRWAVTLAGYDYELVYRRGIDHANADCMSRLPLNVTTNEAPTPADTIHVLEQLDTTQISAARIREQTKKDPVLSQVAQLLEGGWAEGVKTELSCYYGRRDELSLQEGVILIGSRVVIPTACRSTLLVELHQSHPGMVRMKTLARSYIYWPGLDKDIERVVRDCDLCQEHRRCPPRTVMHPWEWPDKPWSRIHADFAGPFLGHMFLILIDAHSKWVDVHIMNTITSDATIEKLQGSFAIHGLPDTLVTDNGPSFKSECFAQFTAANGITHLTSAPFHPASNGLAERTVQTFKNSMRKLTGGSVQNRVNRFLFRYRITPQTTTGQSPAELLMKRKLKCRLSLVRPDTKQRVQQQQIRMKAAHDRKAVERDFKIGEEVYYRTFPKRGNRAGVIEGYNGSDYGIRDKAEGSITRRHPDHIFKGEKQEEEKEDVVDYSSDQLPPEMEINKPGVEDVITVTPVVVRRSQRMNKGMPPARLDI